MDVLDYTNLLPLKFLGHSAVSYPQPSVAALLRYVVLPLLLILLYNEPLDKPIKLGTHQVGTCLLRKS